MNNTQDIIIWVLTGLFAVSQFIAVLILKQGRDTNGKVTEQGLALARLEQSGSSTAMEVNRLRDNLETVRSDMSRIGGAHELAKEIVAVFSEAARERRTGTRRESER